MSNSYTKKHNKFIAGSMILMTTKHVPGIGDAYSRKLAQNGIHKASKLLKIFNECDRDQFIKRIQQLTEGNPCHMNQVYDALNQWNQQHEVNQRVNEI